MFSVILRNEPVTNDSDVKNHEDSSSVLIGYVNVFLEDLPKGLQPKRTAKGFQIDLKKEVKPIKNGLYRMSHTELGEIKIQVEDLIEMGFVRPRKSHLGISCIIFN